MSARPLRPWVALAIAALFATTACAPGAPVTPVGAPATAAPTPARQSTLTGKVIAPVGFQALVLTSNLVAAGGGNLVAAGGGNVIVNNGGNLVAAGGGNLVAAGGGNLVAAGGGNLVAAGGGNLVAAGGGNLVAAGGGNLVAAGGGNLNQNIVSAGGGSILEKSGLVAAGGGNLVAAGGGNLVAAGGDNLVAAGGGNLVAAGGGNLTGAPYALMQVDNAADETEGPTTTYDERQAPLIGAEVYLADADGNPLTAYRPTISDTTGRYEFNDVPAGLHVVIAVRIRTPGNVGGTMQTITTTQAGQNDADVTLTTTMLSAIMLEDQDGQLLSFDPATFDAALASLDERLEAFVEENPDVDLASPETLHTSIVEIVQADPVFAQAVVVAREETEGEQRADDTTNTDDTTDPTDTDDTTNTDETQARDPAEDGAQDDDSPRSAATQVEIRPGGVSHEGTEAITRVDSPTSPN